MSEDAPNRLDELLAEQREIAQLGLRDLQARYESQPVIDRLRFGAEQKDEQTLLGNPGQPFHGAAVLNPTQRTIGIGFAPGAGRQALLACPAFSGIVWPAQYVDLSLAVNVNDALTPSAEVLAVRLPFPVNPHVFQYGRPFTTEAWGEQAEAEGGETVLAVATPAGRTRTVTNVSAMLVNTAAVGAPKVLALTMKSKGATVFKAFLTQQKTAEAGGVDRFNVPVNIQLGAGEEARLTCEAGSAGVRVLLSMSGTIQ